MFCPGCGGLTKVTDTRDVRPYGVRRRRECLRCKERFTTYEIVPVNMLTEVNETDETVKHLRAQVNTLLDSLGRIRRQLEQPKTTPVWVIGEDRKSRRIA